MFTQPPKRFTVASLAWGVCSILLAIPPQAAVAQYAVELIGKASISGQALDLSKASNPLAEGVPHNLLGGFSAVEYWGDHQCVLLSDRGPLDGAVDYRCRFHEFQLQIQEGAKDPVALTLVGTRLFTDPQGRQFTGLAAGFEPTQHLAGRFDAEGIRRLGENWVVSDEYGPDLIEFSPAGRELRRFAVPTDWRIQYPSADRDEEGAMNPTGRLNNNGLEGLAITPQGTLVSLLQRPLMQDSHRTETGWFEGVNCRMLEIHASDGTLGRQFVYQLDLESNKLNEILALDEHRFLTIERDGKAGADAKVKHIMLIDTSTATDVSKIERLPSHELPAAILPVAKQVYIDMLDPTFGLSGEEMPEKIEGLAFGPRLQDGRRTLLVCSDNDFVPNNPSILYVFALGNDTTSNGEHAQQTPRP